MALSATIGEQPSDHGRAVNISHPHGPWVACYGGNVSAPANSGNTVTNPSQISGVTSATALFYRDSPGQYLDIRCGYPASATVVSASPTVQAFGKDPGDSTWTQLFTTASIPAQTSTLTLDTSDDVTGGSLKYTSIQYAGFRIVCRCRENRHRHERR
jgi:hypothetical protein